MAGWYHRHSGHELGQIPGDGEWQGGLLCCSPWGHKELNTTGYWTTTTINILTFDNLFTLGNHSLEQLKYKKIKFYLP